MNRRFLPALAVAIFFLLLAGHLRAQIVWSGAANRFVTGSNWVGGIAPGATDTAQFGNHSGATTIFVNSTTVNNLEFLGTRTAVHNFSYDDGVAVLTLNGNFTAAAGPNINFFLNSTNRVDLSLGNGEHVFDIGGSTVVTIDSVLGGTGHLTKIGTGTLVLTDASTLAYNGIGGFNSAIAVNGGTLHIDGGAISQPFQDIIVGSVPSATGTLLVSNGGTVADSYGVAGNDNGTNATITVTGAGSTWTNAHGMAIGYLGTGYLNILAGGTVTTTGSGSDHSYLGLQTGTAGTAVVDGAGSTWSTLNDYLIIGGGGNGDLTISNGGSVLNAQAFVARSVGGTGTVTVNNGSWTNSAELYVGYNGNGTLNISNGGTVSDTTGHIGWAATTNSSAAYVDGVGSEWNNSTYLYVGLLGGGSLSITNGGTVSSPNTSIGNNTGGYGTITVDGSGSLLSTTNTLYVGSAGSGTLYANAGATVTSNTASIGNNAGGDGSASIYGGAIWNNTGSVLAGNASTGSLYVYGTGSLSAADLTVGVLSGVTGSVDLEDTGSAVSTTGNTIVGDSGTGHFSVFYGAAATTGGNLIIGNNAGSNGTATLIAAGSTWSVAGNVYLGNAGYGAFFASNGALNVGSGSGTIYLGHSGGTGNLFIGYDGESNDTGALINAAAITGGSGSATVYFSPQTNSSAPYYLTKDGTASGAPVLLNGTLNVANNGGYTVLKGANTYSGATSVSGGTLVFDGGSTSGSGNVSTQNGGQIIFKGGGHSYSYAGFIGAAGSGGTSSVQGAGTLWQVGDELIVGAFGGQGTLNIQGGAHVDSYRGSISYIGPATSYVTVDGAGSQWNNTNRLYVGSAGGNARLNVTNGGLVTSTTSAIGLDGAYGWATITGNGSAWSDTTSVAVGANAGSTGFLQLNEYGTLTIAGGTGTLTLGANTAAGTLIIGDSEYYTHGGILNAATVTTGTGTGTVKFDTNTTSAAPYYFTKDGTLGGAAVTITGSTEVRNSFGYTVLSGANTYTGGTTILGGTLVAASNSALGTGSVTVNGGTLRIASGVAFANPLNFTSGTLGGSGTFLSSFTIGTGMHLSPGNSPGTLTFSNGLVLAGGGTLDFEVQAATGTAGVGYDLLNVFGDPISITATSGSPFTLKLISLNSLGNPGAVSDFSPGGTYTWTFATSAAGINGFTADQFVVDTTAFANSIGAGTFTITQSGNDLQLNFLTVPEPSTYVLLGGGLLSAAAALRRRRQSTASR